jgi:nicotinate phosphoribosyltransferase
MGVSGKDGLRRANRCALERWSDTYDGNLGIALTDTFGSAAFFEDFDGKLARLYDGVRHDSGDPFEFGDKVIDHYVRLGIKPTSRTIIFSDGLDVELAIRIHQYFAGKIQISFGIGTHFTNDFEGSSALSIVIKLWSISGVPVVKISDQPAKIQGDSDACRVAKWTFFGTPLDTSAGQS